MEEKKKSEEDGRGECGCVFPHLLRQQSANFQPEMRPKSHLPFDAKGAKVYNWWRPRRAVLVGAAAIAINAHANQTDERTGRSLLAHLLLQFFCL